MNNFTRSYGKILENLLKIVSEMELRNKKTKFKIVPL